MIIDFGSGHRDSASEDFTLHRGHIGFKGADEIGKFREPVNRHEAAIHFQNNDFKALGRILLLMEQTFFGRASSEQRKCYREFARALLDEKKASWSEVKEGLEHVANPTVLITRADQFLLRDDGEREYIPMPATSHVPAGEAVLDVINSANFQRLRGVKQLSFCEWYFPGGTHTRFEHSIGVFGVAYSALQHLVRDPVFRENYNQRNINGALLAALVHDIGHYPFAHVIEHYVAARYHSDKNLKDSIHHFNYTIKLLEQDQELRSSICGSWGEDTLEEAIRNLNGNSTLVSEMLDGPIDCDKLDYLRRDAHHCGVPYGQGLNVDQILSSFRCSPTANQLVIAESGLPAVEGMVLVQDQMLKSVYWHEGTRALFAMFHRFLDLAVGKDKTRLIPIVDGLKRCSNEYEALEKVFLPLTEQAKAERTERQTEGMLELVGLHHKYNFKAIYRCIARYSQQDRVLPRGRLSETIYQSIVKQNLTNLTLGPLTATPIDWNQVRRLRQCFIDALKEKRIKAEQFEVLIDVPWGKGANRIVKILMDDGSELPITKVSHLNETIFTLPTAHNAPVRVYFSPSVFQNANPVLTSILQSVREKFDNNEMQASDAES